MKSSTDPLVFSGKSSIRTSLLLICFFSCLVFLHITNGAMALTAGNASKVIEGQIDHAKQAQKTFENWEGEKAVLLSEIRDAKIRSLWLEFQRQKYQNYLGKQQKVIEELKQKKIDAKKIRMELEPFLEQLVMTLEKRVANDLPFLLKERRERIAFLKESLADYHIDLSEKLRRILEALRVEAEYGKTVESTEEMLKLNGEPTKVVVVRIGRIGLFFRSLEGNYIGRWNQNKRAWEMLSSTYAPVIADASEMASGKRAVELLDLPLGPIKQQ